MAKYVCDFAEVISAGEKLCSAANSLKTDVQNYDTSITSDLSAWSGEAKNSFISQCAGQVELAIEKTKKLQETGEFIKSSAESIQNLESQLASLNI